MKAFANKRINQFTPKKLETNLHMSSNFQFSWDWKRAFMPQCFLSMKSIRRRRQYRYNGASFLVIIVSSNVFVMKRKYTNNIWFWIWIHGPWQLLAINMRTAQHQLLGHFIHLLYVKRLLNFTSHRNTHLWNIFLFIFLGLLSQKEKHTLTHSVLKISFHFQSGY